MEINNAARAAGTCEPHFKILTHCHNNIKYKTETQLFQCIHIEIIAIIFSVFFTCCLYLHLENPQMAESHLCTCNYGVFLARRKPSAHLIYIALQLMLGVVEENKIE